MKSSKQDGRWLAIGIILAPRWAVVVGRCAILTLALPRILADASDCPYAMLEAQQKPFIEAMQTEDIPLLNDINDLSELAPPICPHSFASDYPSRVAVFLNRRAAKSSR